MRIENAKEIQEYVLIGVGADGQDKEWPVMGEAAIIRSHTVIYYGNKIGKNFQTGHGVLIRENNSIGDDVSVGSGTVIEHDVVIGNGVRIHSNAFVPEYSILEDGCWLGPNVVITNAKYPKSKDVKKNLKGAIVRTGAKVGANSTILPGVEVGVGALVGAGSVVTKNIPAGAVAYGNPALVVKQLQDLPCEYD